MGSEVKMVLASILKMNLDPCHTGYTNIDSRWVVFNRTMKK